MSRYLVNRHTGREAPARHYRHYECPRPYGNRGHRGERRMSLSNYIDVFIAYSQSSTRSTSFRKGFFPGERATEASLERRLCL